MGGVGGTSPERQADKQARRRERGGGGGGRERERDRQTETERGKQGGRARERERQRERETEAGRERGRERERDGKREREREREGWGGGVERGILVRAVVCSIVQRWSYRVPSLYLSSNSASTEKTGIVHSSFLPSFLALSLDTLKIRF